MNPKCDQRTDTNKEKKPRLSFWCHLVEWIDGMSRAIITNEDRKEIEKMSVERKRCVMNELTS